MREPIEKQVLTALRRIVRAIELHSRKLVQTCGITGPQLVVLRELEHGYDMTVGEIALNVSLSSATVTVIVDRLENRNLVERARSNRDRRRVLIRLTEAGQNLLLTAPPLFQEQFMEKLKRLQPWEETLVLSTLQRIVSMMEVEDVDASSLLVSGPLTAAAEATESFLAGSSQETPAPPPGRNTRQKTTRSRSGDQPGGDMGAL